VLVERMVNDHLLLLRKRVDQQRQVIGILAPALGIVVSGHTSPEKRGLVFDWTEVPRLFEQLQRADAIAHRLAEGFDGESHRAALMQFAQELPRIPADFNRKVSERLGARKVGEQ
jgi:hypothetical protein